MRYHRPSLDQLIAKQPALADLLTDAASVQVEPGEVYCRHKAWAVGFKDHPSFKRRLSELIGNWAHNRDPLLITCQAYDAAGDALLKELPPCQNCLCVDEDGYFVFADFWIEQERKAGRL